MNSRVCVLGSINMDVVVRVDRFPLLGETVPGFSYNLMPGGKGANQAVAIANMGVQVDLIGTLGTDEFGKLLLEYLVWSGVNVEAVVQADTTSGTAIVMVNKEGCNQIVVVPGSNAMLQWNSIESYLNRWGTAVQYLVSQFEVPLDHICSAFDRAKCLGAVTVLNPSPMQPIPTKLIELTDIFLLNEVEFSQVVGASEVITSSDGITEAALRWARDIGDKIVIVTLGEKGLVAIQEGRIIRQSSEKIARVVDTTGAGDCFCGSLVAFLHKGLPLVDSLLFAQKAAAYSVQAKGASPSFPKLAALDLKEMKGEVK